MDARALDKFYTRSDVAEHCVTLLHTWLDAPLNSLTLDIIEPSAGSGAFLPFLPHTTLAYDIAPEHPQVRKKNFLLLKRKKPALIVGNPPFGRISKDAIAFFNHAATFATHIAFILPRSFEKPSIQNRLHTRFHLTHSHLLDPNSFLLNNAAYHVPCVFQLWIKRPYDRLKHELPTTHPDFQFTTKDQAAFAIQRVGVNAGRIKHAFAQCSKNSHYFIRCMHHKDTILPHLSDLESVAEKFQTAGNPSLAKTDIVKHYTQRKLLHANA